MTIKIKGLPEFEAKLNRWTHMVRQGLAAGATEWAERTMAVSKDGGENYGGRICPVDTGTLMGTGHVAPPTIKGDSVEITLGYGGPAAKYAIYVHEMDEGANWSRPGSGPGYLRDPVMHMKNQIGEIIGPRLKAVLK